MSPTKPSPAPAIAEESIFAGSRLGRPLAHPSTGHCPEMDHLAACGAVRARARDTEKESMEINQADAELALPILCSGVPA